jgi:transcriptional regulator with XRE-family HTH domain
MEPLHEKEAAMRIRKFRNLIGPAVRRLRCERNWSQEKLLSELQDQGWNICRTHLTRIESCEVWVGDFELAVIAKALGVEVKELYPKIEDNEKPMYAVLSDLMHGQVKTLMSPDEILEERSRPLRFTIGTDV